MIAISVVKIKWWLWRKQAITIYVFFYEEMSNSCFQIKVLKQKSRISILFIFSHCFMLPFPPYPILWITLNAKHVASSARFFSYVSPLAGFFFRQVSFAGILFLGTATPAPVISNGPSLKGARKNGAHEGETRVSLARPVLSDAHYFSSACYAG